MHFALWKNDKNLTKCATKINGIKTKINGFLSAINGVFLWVSGIFADKKTHVKVGF
jgi:hypothetical protein